jgi:hypothetical protein
MSIERKSITLAYFIPTVKTTIEIQVAITNINHALNPLFVGGFVLLLFKLFPFISFKSQERGLKTLFVSIN